MPTTSQSTALPSIQRVNWALADALHIERKRSGHTTRDTLAPAGKAPAVDTKGFDQVALPKPGPQNPSYLTELAEAFSNIYRQLAKGVSVQTDQFVTLQEIDQTMSQDILQATNVAVGKQKDALDAQNKVFLEQARQEKDAKALEIIGYVVMGAVALITVVSAFFDAGISLALETPELEVGEEMTESVEEEAVTETPKTAEQPEEILDGVQEDTQSSTKIDELQEGEKAAQKSQDQAVKSYKELSESNKKWLKFRDALRSKWTKRITSLAGSVTYGIPQAMDAESQIKISIYLKRVAKTQRAVGPKVSFLQELNGYLTFYQELVKRSMGVIQDLSEQLGNTISTDSKLFGLIRSTTISLAQAV